MLETVTPAVVNISIERAQASNRSGIWRDPFFDPWFPRQQNQRRTSAGSGVIIDAEKGHVVTNHHVIANATAIDVVLQDKRQLKASVVGSDAKTDVALLRVEPDELEALTFSDSDRVRVGDYVVAVGNPYGLGQTVTSGIISALGRSGLNLEEYEYFLQTDAPINPGNSGGPLIDLRGNIIGINTAIAGPTGSSVGIGFAIPSNTVLSVVAQLAEYGNMNRGVIGISMTNIDQDFAEENNLDSLDGVYVQGVRPGSNADLSGVERGDVIIAVDFNQIDSPAELRSIVGLKRIGDPVALDIIRDGVAQRVMTEVGDHIFPVTAPNSNLRGVTFRDIPEIHALHGRVSGVLVSDIERDSLAHRAGLRQNDIVTAMNRNSIARIEQVMDLEERQHTVELRVMRGTNSIYIRLN